MAQIFFLKEFKKFKGLKGRDVKYLRVKNYEKLQHYRGENQNQVWIKLYKNLVNSSDWARLKDNEKAWMIGILCIANKHGCVENDASLIRVRAQLRRKPDLKKLEEIGFIVPTDSNGDGDSIKILESELPYKKERAEEKKNTGVDTNTPTLIAPTLKNFSSKNKKFNLEEHKQKSIAEKDRQAAEAFALKEVQ